MLYRNKIKPQREKYYRAITLRLDLSPVRWEAS